MTRTQMIRTMLLCSVVALAGCEDREVIFEGKRESLRSPDPEVVGEAQAARFAKAEAEADENRAVPVSVGAARSLSSWSQRGGNAAHATGNLAFSSAPQVIYAVDIGVGNDRKHKITAEPIVADGRVFTMDAQSQVMAHSTNGAALWVRPLTPSSDKAGDAGNGGLAYGAGRVFATTGFGELVALDGNSGAPVWTQRLEAAVSGAPIFSGGDVYVLTEDNRLVSVDAASGRVNWDLDGTPARPGVAGFSSPAITGGTVIAPFSLGTVVGVKASDGTPLWGVPVAGRRAGRAYTFANEISGEPVIVGSTIYVGSMAGRTAAMSTKGDLKWTSDDGAMGAVTVAGGSVFMVADNLKLVRLNASTGKRVWAVDLPGFEKDVPRRRKSAYQSYGPTLAGGRLWVASSDGYLRAFDPASGALISAVELPAGAASRPVIVGGVAYIATVKGTLVALR